MRYASLSAALLAAAATLSIGFLTTSEASSSAPLLVEPSAPKTLTIDSGHSSVLFRIKHMEASYFYGRFNELSGEVIYDEADPSKSSVEVEIKATSVDSNSEKRDQHILSPDFLDAKQFPKLSFKSTKVERDGAVWKATGDLRFHGTQQEVTLEFEQTGESEGRGGGVVMGFHTRFEIDRTDWGMTGMVGPLGKEIELTISLETKGK